MKKDRTYVDGSKFEEIILSSGATHSAQAGFIKVSGAKGRNMYVARTKRVARVDLSGFTADGIPGVAPYDGELKHGSVTHGLDFSLPEEQILAAFRACLEHMLTLPAAEPRKKVAPMSNKSDSAAGWSNHIPKADTKEAKQKRLDLIKRVAAEKGVSISERTQAALCADEVEELA